MQNDRSIRPSTTSIVATAAVGLTMAIAATALSVNGRDVDATLSRIGAAQAATFTETLDAAEVRPVEDAWRADRSADGTRPDEAH